MAEQPGRKFPPTISTTRAGQTPLPTDAKSAEIRHRPCPVHNNLNQERHLYSRRNFKLNRTDALAEWRELGAS